MASAGVLVVFNKTDSIIKRNNMVSLILFSGKTGFELAF